jgi:hypothetical protein
MAGSVAHIHARQAALYVDKSAVTFANNASIDSIFSAGQLFKVVNMTITPPESGADLINLWGSDSLDTVGAGVPMAGTWQIQAMDQKAWTMAKVSFTLVFSHDETGDTTAPGGTATKSFESIFHGPGQAITSTPAATRYPYGDQVTSTRILTGVIAFVWNASTTGGTNAINTAIMQNVIITKMGDIKLTGTDGHYQQDCEIVCLAKDFVQEKVA